MSDIMTREEAMIEMVKNGSTIKNGDYRYKYFEGKFHYIKEGHKENYETKKWQSFTWTLRDNDNYTIHKELPKVKLLHFRCVNQKTVKGTNMHYTINVGRIKSVEEGSVAHKSILNEKSNYEQVEVL